jgi:hypothetical protein
MSATHGRGWWCAVVRLNLAPLSGLISDEDQPLAETQLHPPVAVECRRETSIRSLKETSQQLRTYPHEDKSPGRLPFLQRTEPVVEGSSLFSRQHLTMLEATPRNRLSGREFRWLRNPDGAAASVW